MTAPQASHAAPLDAGQLAAEQERLARWNEELQEREARWRVENEALTRVYAAMLRDGAVERGLPARVWGIARWCLRPRVWALAGRWRWQAFRAGQALGTRHLREALRIASAGLFDADYYRRQYKDVPAGMDPLLHFVLIGGREGRRPHPAFDTPYYLYSCPDVDPAQTNPLWHFLEYGTLERRRPNPEFDPLAYAAAHPEVFASGINPLVHRLAHPEAAPSAGGETFGALDRIREGLARVTGYPVRTAAGPGQPVNPAALELHWIIPAFSRGDGGIMNVFRTIAFLESFGHRNTLWIQNLSARTGAREAERLLRDHFVQLAAPVRLLPEDPGVIAGDAVIATDRWTAYAARAVAHVARRFYFVQDYEPLFYPVGAENLLAEATYRFGFDCLSNGDWLDRMMRERYGAWSCVWQQAFDPVHYHPGDEAGRAPGHIAFYARHSTPRRAVELGMLALDGLQRTHGGRFHVDFFGLPVGRLNVGYAYTDHGVLTARELGALYRRCQLGVVFSTTNYSIVTREMMGCGLPVVDLDVESVRAAYPAGCLEMAPPTPEGVAATLGRLLDDASRRDALVRAAGGFVSQFTWESAARAVERGLRERLAS